MAEDASDPGLGPLPFVRERDVDLLLAEAVSSDNDFRRWLFAQLPGMDRSHEIKTLEVRVSDWRDGASADGLGETDVRIDIEWADGVSGLVSIENKIAAVAQPDQGRRHRAFVASSQSALKAAVLVAPQIWIDGYPDEVSEYDKTVSIDAIAEYHLSRRSETVAWRGRVFAQAVTQRPTAVSAPDLDQWCADLDDMIRERGLRLAPQRRVRTPVPGRSKSDRFIWCADETLVDIGGLWPSLIFKTASGLLPGRVAIEVSVRSNDVRREKVVLSAEAHDLAVRTTEASVIVELCPSESADLILARSIAEQRDAVEALVDSGRQLQKWWNEVVPDALAE
jgi:hypothetical protein